MALHKNRGKGGQPLVIPYIRTKGRPLQIIYQSLQGRQWPITYQIYVYRDIKSSLNGVINSANVSKAFDGCKTFNASSAYSSGSNNKSSLDSNPHYRKGMLSRPALFACVTKRLSIESKGYGRKTSYLVFRVGKATTLWGKPMLWAKTMKKWKTTNKQ